MWTVLCLVLFYTQGLHAQVCGPNDSQACCDAGGICKDAIFDDCFEGDFDYSIRCPGYGDECCVPRATQPPTTTTEATTAASTEAPTTDPDATEDPNPTTPQPPWECGSRPSSALPERVIIGGEESTPNSWPWSVSVELDYFEIGGWQHYCGGVLIDPQWVVTAAHCVAKSSIDDPQFYRVALRMHNKENKEPDVINMGVSKMIYHEAYDPDTPGSPADIALLKFVEPIEYDEKMSPICLTDAADQDFSFLNSTCYITGWGLTKGTGDDRVHREALIPVITNELCDRKWEEGSGRVNLIKDNHICVGNGGPQGPGACNGDSGGPLSCLVDGQWVLAGVTSFGASGCVAEDAPDVYTRVPYFIDWIQDTMDAN